mmetsp:Transcript_111815/g.311150  ORF Transcript_111815/g.311150 Transcript_111815/m.311150 type:complete len:238 (-) Transcript_111815:372-1085(-)
MTGSMRARCCGASARTSRCRWCAVTLRWRSMSSAHVSPWSWATSSSSTNARCSWRTSTAKPKPARHPTCPSSWPTASFTSRCTANALRSAPSSTGTLGRCTQPSQMGSHTSCTLGHYVAHSRRAASQSCAGWWSGPARSPRPRPCASCRPSCSKACDCSNLPQFARLSVITYRAGCCCGSLRVTTRQERTKRHSRACRCSSRRATRRPSMWMQQRLRPNGSSPWGCARGLASRALTT